MESTKINEAIGETEQIIAMLKNQMFIQIVLSLRKNYLQSNGWYCGRRAS